jgi:cell division transport system permease protein
MEPMRSLWYFLKEALGNSKKNFSTTFGAIITIFLSLLVIGVFMTASILIDRIVQSVESQVSISIFVNDNANQDDINALKTSMESIPQVEAVVFVTKEQSLEEFKEMSTIEIVEQLDGNPLPAKFSVTLADPEQVQAVVNQITADSHYLSVIDNPSNPADSIRYGQQIVDRLFMFSNIVRSVCLVLVLLLVFVALIFINNTIRLAILARRKEIAIMRLVGASNGFIRGPFLMEGALQAIVGAALAAGSISLIASMLLPQMSEWMAWLPIDYASLPLWQIYGVLFAVGIIIGLFGSLFAMRRYLKV